MPQWIASQTIGARSGEVMMVDELSARNLTLREALAVARRDPAAAIAMLKAALVTASTPEDAAALAKHAGIISRGTGDFSSAIDLYSQAAAADPKDAYVHLALAQLHRELGQISDARRALAMCLKAIEGSRDEDLRDVVQRELTKLGTPPPDDT